MLGLHNILLISQPSSSSQHSHPPPPSTTSSDHPHRHHSTNNDHLTESSFWSLQKKSKDGGDHNDDDDDDDDNDDCYGDGSPEACRDCGNRAKKECSFKRCRTCCKTRGFDCATHVRSTWVPASKRREKKLSTPASASSYGVKRPRPFVVPSPSSHNVSTTITTPATSSSSANDLSFGISSHPQDSAFKKSLPGRIEAPAVFRNIKVTDISDGEAETAYVVTVNIRGHVFKGLLYDHGSDKNNVFPFVTKLQTETSTSGRYRDSSSQIVDPSNAYTAASGN